VIRRLFGRRSPETTQGRLEMSASPPPTGEGAILAVLDRGCDDFVFPMLDNGYVYLAAARLSLYRSAADWAMTFEIFGFSPRAAAPDVSVWTFGSRIAGRKGRADHVSQDAYEAYLAAHPYDDAESFFPVGGDWQDPEWGELVSITATSVTVRDRLIEIPDRATLVRHGIELAEPDRVRTYELCRYLAAVAREDVLATKGERRTHVPSELDDFLILDDWHHPDTVNGERASDTVAFRSLARALASGDAADYEASEEPNTHWSHWPFGGSL
jgi:hypothetical protein